MRKLQFRVLHREFLFRLIDRDVLSASAQGDASKLLGRLAAILVLLSIPFALSLIGIGDSRLPQQAKLISAWGAEHALIATTMLIVGLFSVLSWDSAFPNRRDALVLGALPLPSSTIFLAKIAALAAALGSTVIVFNAASGLLLPAVLAPREATPLDLLMSPQFYRTFAAYWMTMFAAGAFVLGCVLILQGLAAQLPRRLFLRVSAGLQLIAFCVFLAGYFLEPALASQKALAGQENRHILLWLPSYWFLALFQQLNGSVDGSAHSVLIMLAGRAWICLGAVGVATSAIFFWSYFRTLRKIIEQPDIVSTTRSSSWLPRFGSSINTVIAQFSIRTLLRSRQHRMLFSFYLGIGFAIVILFLKTPDARRLSGASGSWHQVSVPLLASSFVIMCACILASRIVFAIPLELRANWIFRATQVRPAKDYMASSHRAAYVLALAPVWCTSAILFVSLWPWRPALGHMAILVLLGVIIAEVWLCGFYKIPFTCSYLPGKSNLHITFLLCIMLGLNAIFWSARFEHRALSDPLKYLGIMAVLSTAAMAAWLRRARATANTREIQFEEEIPPAITILGISST